MGGICYLIGILIILGGAYLGVNSWPSPYELDRIIELKRTLAGYYFASSVAGGVLFISLGEVLRKLELLVAKNDPTPPLPKTEEPPTDAA